MVLGIVFGWVSRRKFRPSLVVFVKVFGVRFSLSELKAPLHVVTCTFLRVTGEQR